MRRVYPSKPLRRLRALLVLALALAFGCGGGNDHAKWGGMSKEEWQALHDKKIQEERAAEAVENQKKAKQAVAPPPPQAPQATKKPARRIARESDDDAPPPARKPEKPERPQDFADWKPDDFSNARRENDPRLTAAVAYLGLRFFDRQGDAVILTALLEKPPPDPNAEEPPRYNPQRGADGKLVEAILAALIANGTPLARQTLERLAAEEFIGAANRPGAATALKLLISSPSQENDESIFRAIASVDFADADHPARMDGKQISKTALELIRLSASERLRIRLAEYMTTAPPSVFAVFWPCLREPKPENLLAQAILYQSDRTDAAAKELLERGFLARIGDAREEMWTDKFVATVENRLLAIDTLEKGKTTIALAGAIPSARMRNALAQILMRHWEENPKTLESMHAPEFAATEPGFLAVVKTLPRLNYQTYENRRNGASIAGNRQSAATKSKAASPLEAKRKKEEIARQWMMFSEDVLKAMCRRFRAEADPSSAAEDLPVKFHASASIVATYRSAPTENSPKSPAPSSAAPAMVCYARAEQRGRPSRVLAYYRRQLPNNEEHPIREGAWLETSSIGSVSKSIDVLITRPSGSSPDLADEEQRLIVEVLSVECEGLAPREKNKTSVVRANRSH